MLANQLRNIQCASRWLRAFLVLLAVLFLINGINTLGQPFPPDTRTLAGVVFHGTALPSFPGGALISSCVFMFASRLMNEGRELRDEHDLVI